jgi:uncharacterized damage-inducible protein DinB
MSRASGVPVAVGTDEGAPEQLLEAWRTNNRISLFLIERIGEDGLGSTLSKHGGRTVAGQLAHMHNNRVWHLEKRAKDLAEGLVVFATKTSPARAELMDAFQASGAAIETFLTDLSEGKPKRRGFRKGLATTLAYFVAHESHHRGSILLTLKQCGHKLDQKTSYAIWDWDRI